jgi:outer membrane protein OmpA-like peptidoglycan-associated protein
MKILIAGSVMFVVWCFVSAWLYNDKLLPAMKRPLPLQTISESQTNGADSLTKLKALMPKNLMVYFEFNDAKFKPDPLADNRIPEFKSWIDKYPGSLLNVTGHTDLVGTVEFNQALGLKRALIVVKYLEDKGIPADKIISESKGKSQPVADYLTEDGRAKNRRTEISIKMP